MEFKYSGPGLPDEVRLAAEALANVLLSSDPDVRIVNRFRFNLAGGAVLEIISKLTYPESEPVIADFYTPGAKRRF